MTTDSRRIDPTAATRLSGVAEKLELMLESERWPRPRLDQWTADRLAELAAAARHAPFYAERLPAELDLESLAEVEPLTRAELQQRADELDSGIGGPRIEWFTSGTSGRPVRVEHGPEVLGFNVASRWRHQTRFGLPARQLPEAGFEVKAAPGGPPIRRLSGEPPRFLLNHWTLGPDELPAAHEMIVAAGGARLTGGWPSMVDAWALLYEASELDPTELGLELCASGAEPVLPEQRERIAGVFGCSIGQLYGMREVAVMACECACGSLHINEERVLVEILDPAGERVSAGERGEVVATLLHSYEMPLIRYRTGDSARLIDGPCECGLTLARLDLEIGRLDDMVMRADGAPVSSRFVRKVLEDELGGDLLGHRSEQTGPGEIAIKLELRGSPPRGLRQALARSLSAHLGEPVGVALEIGEIPPRRAGEKLRTFTRSWQGPGR